MNFQRNTQIFITIVLCAFLAACTTKKIVPITVTPEDEIEKVEIIDSVKEDITELSVYPSEFVGTIRDLYGEESFNEQSEAYRDAIEQTYDLRYNIIYFAYDSAEISDEAKKLLRVHADYLSNEDNVIVALEGHADQRGSAGYNLALGERRAIAVQKILVAYGVAKSQLLVISFGEEKLAIDGEGEEDYKENRRVEIVYQ